MRELSRYLGLITIVVALGCAAHARQKPADEPKTNPDALVLLDFNERIKSYMKIHKEHEGDAPPMKETEDPAKITASQKALADKIRAARKGARQGEIFTPAIRTKFRQLMYPETVGTAGRETKSVMKEDAPTTATIPLKVNAEYPQSQPLPTVPPNVLAALPPLPEDLEYRIIEKHLILRDVHANIIVDYIPNAIR